MKVANVAIAGNPNCGKSTLFNGLTGGKQRVGNWPGVTVERKEGVFQIGETEVCLVDLPGIYSLSAYSEDEKIAEAYLTSGAPELIVNVLDASNLERNLFLTLQLIEMKVPLVVVLNMWDVAEAKGTRIDPDRLSLFLDCPVLPVTATNLTSIEVVKHLVAEKVHSPQASSLQISYPPELEREIALLEPALSGSEYARILSARWIAVKVLEGDEVLEAHLQKEDLLDATQLAEARLRTEQSKDSADIIIADTRYAFIEEVIRESVQKGPDTKSITDKIDAIVLNKYLGIPFFLFAMYMVFWATINLGGVFIDFFDLAFGAIFVDGVSGILEGVGAPQFIISLLGSGVGGGIQTLATFIPIIFIMFLMISLLEGLGYMARAAFVMDRVMRWIGLPGKAFIPLLVGFGCTVPAIMATRTLENKRDRFLTVFMAPFMSCGARLPVYALFAAAFFPEQGQNIIFALYMLGILLAVLTGLLLKSTLFKGEPAHFIMELPPYHFPQLGFLFGHAYIRLKSFLQRSGRILIPVITVLGLLNTMGTDGSFGNENTENSVLSYMGKKVTPAFASMGIEEDNWPASVGLFTGLFAKEVIVGTLNALYFQGASQDESDQDSAPPLAFGVGASLKDAFKTIPANLIGLGQTLTDPLGLNINTQDAAEVSESVGVDQSIFTAMRLRFSGGPYQAFAYLIFILLYAPCVVAVTATKREIGLILTVLQVYYSTMLAWVLATLFYQVMVGGSVFWIVTASLTFILSITLINIFAKWLTGEPRITT
jgi:ferrous iron transport protein B